MVSACKPVINSIMTVNIIILFISYNNNANTVKINNIVVGAPREAPLLDIIPFIIIIISMNYKHIFGPVPSRRLGISLGIDIIPFKTCTFDCVYCECGKTTDKTSSRKQYVPYRDVIREIDHFLANNPRPDIITMSGSGEPMLNSYIGNIIDYVKAHYPGLKLGLITNSSVFADHGAVDEILNADIILPSLDSAKEESFKCINRPYGGCSISDIINGLIYLRSRFTGQIWLEIFILKGLNDSPGDIESLKHAVHRIKPDRVQLNTLDRPGTEQGLVPADKDLLEHIRKSLDYEHTEIISKYKSRKEIASFRQDIENAVLDTIKRRPCTVEDLSEILGINMIELNKYIDVLIKEKKISVEYGQRGIFLRAQ